MDDGKRLSSMYQGFSAKVLYVMARPLVPFDNSQTLTEHPARIQLFMQHNLALPNENKNTTFAVVNWP